MQVVKQLTKKKKFIRNEKKNKRFLNKLQWKYDTHKNMLCTFFEKITFSLYYKKSYYNTPNSSQKFMKLEFILYS